MLTLCYPALSFAETIVLKSGRKIEGKIIEKTDQYIKINIKGIPGGMPQTFYSDEVAAVDETNPSQSSTEIIKQLSLGKFYATIHLKSGETVKGEFIEDASDYIKISCGGAVRTYPRSEISSFINVPEEVENGSVDFPAWLKQFNEKYCLPAREEFCTKLEKCEPYGNQFIPESIKGEKDGKCIVVTSNGMEYRYSEGQRKALIQYYRALNTASRNGSSVGIQSDGPTEQFVIPGGTSKIISRGRTVTKIDGEIIEDPRNDAECYVNGVPLE